MSPQNFDNAPGAGTYEEQAQSPAAPSGLQQIAHGAAQSAKGNDIYDDLLAVTQARDEELGYVPASQDWFTGANTQAQRNGWDTDFFNRMIEQYNALAEQQALNTQFERPDATGIVTWDHTSTDGSQNFVFGDIYDKGERVGNVFEQFADDPDTANELMLPILFDGVQQARIFNERDIPKAMREAVAGQREQNNTEIPKTLEQQDFERETQVTVDEFSEGGEQAAIVGGSTLGSAALGAGAGFVVGGPVGAVVGGVGFGLAGLAGSILNRDELTEQAARAKEVTEVAFEDHGTAAGLTAGLQQWGQFTMGMTSPMANLEHGLVEITSGDVGDRESAYYARDKFGNYIRPRWAKPLSLVSNVTDGVLQFMSPLSRAMYTAQMSSVVGGESLTLATTRGGMFDPRTGNFENIFTDDDGNFDPTSGAAGLMKIGIDGVQMVGMLGLARQSARQADELAATGVKAAEGSGTHAAGMKFFTNPQTGELERKFTLAVLAPSEQVAAWSVARAARRTAQARGDVVKADDLYRAAASMSNGSQKLKWAMLNGFGEGYEEFAQGVFEPIAMDGDIDPYLLADAFLQGAAAGVGMSLGATYQAPTGDQKMFMQAYAREVMLNDGNPIDETAFRDMWFGSKEKGVEPLTKQMKKVMATRSTSEIEAFNQANTHQGRSQVARLHASGLDSSMAVDDKKKAVERNLKTASPNLNAYRVLGGMLDAKTDRPPEAHESSAREVVKQLVERYNGALAQQEFLPTRIAELQAMDQTDPSVAAELEESLASQEENRLVVAIAPQILSDLQKILRTIYVPGIDQATQEQQIELLNGVMEGYFYRTLKVKPQGEAAKVLSGVDQNRLRDAASQFVGMLMSREPKLDAGSYFFFLPWANNDLTWRDEDGLLLVNTDVLQAMNADFDGDKMRSEHQLVMSREKWLQGRSGVWLGGAGKVLDIGTRLFDEELSRMMQTSLNEAPGTKLRDEAEAVVANITDEITTRYGWLMSPVDLQSIFTVFREDLESANEDARVNMLNSLALLAGENITIQGRETVTHEWLHASNIIRFHIQEFQTTWRKNRVRSSGPSPEVVNVQEAKGKPGTTVRKQKASTPLQTLAAWAVGNSLFRKFQKIHYSMFNVKVLSSDPENMSAPSDLYEMAQVLAEMSRHVTGPALQDILANDNISAQVLGQLTRLADDVINDPVMRGKIDHSTAMVALAAMKVKDVWMEGGTAVTDTGAPPISVVQLLLKRALDHEQENHPNFETDDKAVARHARLRPLTIANEVKNQVNHERAMVEVFGATQFIDSVGEQHGHFAAHTTPEQWLANYKTLSKEGRKAEEDLYKNHDDYLRRKATHDGPYSFDEFSRREMTAYRAMLDAMMAVGRSEITHDSSKKGEEAYGGRQFDRVKRAIDEFMAGHQAVVSAHKNFRKLYGKTRKLPKDPIKQIQIMFDQNRDQARNILDVMPGAYRNALYEERPDGSLWVAPWVYEMFTISNPEEAVYFYWKNMMFTKARSEQHKLRAKTKGGIRNQIDWRFGRLMYDLAQEPGQHLLQELNKQMDSHTDIWAFYNWLNTTPGFRGTNQAVLLPFNDDVADWEPNSGAGWSTTRNASDLLAAISTMKRSAETLNDTMKFRNARKATDRAIWTGVEWAFNNDPRATPEHYANLNKLKKAVKIATELPRTIAPSTTYAMMLGALRGVDPGSTDKAQAPDFVAEVGEIQQLLDGFGYVPGLERMLEMVTAHSMSSLSNNVSDTARFPGVAMDEFGREITWDVLDVKKIIKMAKDPDSTALAYALMTPKGLDSVDGMVSERMYVDANLSDILDNKQYQKLFELEGDDALDRALKLITIIDGKVRSTGGRYDLIRYVMSLATARTSGVTYVTKENDRKKILDQTILDVARSIVMVGGVLTSGEHQKAGTLDKLKKSAVAKLRADDAIRRASGFVDPDTQQVAEEWARELLEDLETQMKADVQTAAREHGAASNEAAAIRVALQKQFEVNKRYIENLLESDKVGATIARFDLVTVPPALAQQNREAVRRYASALNSAISIPESSQIWEKLAGHTYAGTEPTNIDDDEWIQLSHSVMGHALAHENLTLAGHLSVPPMMPPGTTVNGDPAYNEAKYYKYFDKSYAWIADDLLSETSHIAQAITWLHGVADQPMGITTDDEMLDVLKSTILNPVYLGPHTPGVQAQLVWNEAKIANAGAGPATKAAGNGPRRSIWGLMLKRNARVTPTAQMLSTVSISGAHLSESVNPYAKVAITPAGSTVEQGMTIAQLDNRFYAEVKVNGVVVPMDVGNLGYRWTGESEETGYRYIALPRLLRVVQRMALNEGKTLDQMDVELTFFHPDSKPADPQWANNVYFDGMNHELLPDVGESVVTGLWSDNGAMIGRATQRVIDATKTDEDAVEPFVRPDEKDLAAAEAEWLTNFDLAALIRRHVQLILDYDTEIPRQYYNALYKFISEHYIVVGTKDGKPKAMKAYQVIAHANEHGWDIDPATGARTGLSVPLDFDKPPKLKRLSSDVVRSMVSGADTQGVSRYFEDEYRLNRDVIPEFTHITKPMLDRFGKGWLRKTGSIEDTSLRHVGAQRTLTVKMIQTPEEQKMHETRVLYLNRRTSSINTKRSQKLNEDQVNNDYRHILGLAIGLVDVERNDVAFLKDGIPVAPRDIIASRHTQRLLETSRKIMQRYPFQRGWVLRDEGVASVARGALTMDMIHDTQEEQDWLALNDLLTIDLKTYRRLGKNDADVTARIEEGLAWAVESGTNILLGSGNGKSDDRNEAGRWLMDHGYAPIEGSVHLYGPVEFVRQTQNERAYESTLHETRRIQPINNAVVMLLDDAEGFDENDMSPNPDSQKLKDEIPVNNLLPSGMFKDYNVLPDDGRNDGLHARTLEWARTFTKPGTEYRATLLGWGGPDVPGEMTLATALNRYHKKVMSRTSLLPQEEEELLVGDIILFVHPTGRIIIYRHGFELPKQHELEDMLDREGLNLALAPSKREGTQTANSGILHMVNDKPGYGKRLILRLSQQTHGNIYWWGDNALKMAAVPATERLKKFMKIPVFGNGVLADAWTDRGSADKKEAFEGRVSFYRTAHAFFEWDYSKYMVEFFYPDASTRPADAEVKVYNLLHRLSQEESLKIPTADASILSEIHVALAEQMGYWAIGQEEAEEGAPDWGWLDDFQSGDSNAAMVARAMITYLLTRHAHIDNVWKSPGFSHPSANTEAVRVIEAPGLFMDLLAGPVNAPLHKEIMQHFDDQLYSGPNDSGWKLLPNWVVEVHDEEGGFVRGQLAYGQLFGNGRNPVLNTQAHIPSAQGAVSEFNAIASAGSIGAVTAHQPLKDAQQFISGYSSEGGMNKLHKENGETIWGIFTGWPTRPDTTKAPWRRGTPFEAVYVEEANEEIKGIYRRLGREGWPEGSKQAAFDSLVTGILDVLGLDGTQSAMVDTWIRQMAGRPYKQGEDGEEHPASIVNYDTAIQMATMIKWNVDNHYYPTTSGNIPLMDINFLTVIYRANRDRADGKKWAPTMKKGTRTDAVSWDDWVNTAFGSAWIMPKEKGPDVVPEARFDEMFRLAVDALVHGYQGAMTSTRYLPVSSSTLQNRVLMDPDNNRMLVSTSLNKRQMAEDPMLFYSSQASLREILGNQRIYMPDRDGADPNSAMGQTKARFERWRKEDEIPEQENPMARDINLQGQSFIGHTTTTNQFWRMAINARVGNALFNIPLILAAPVEAFWKRNVNTLANLATGNSTGALGKVQSRISDGLNASKAGAFFQQLGWTTSRTYQENVDIGHLIDSLSTRPEFKAMVYKALMYQYPTMPGIGKIEKWLEQYAKLGARLQDPAWGMLPKDLARIYIETVLNRIASDPTGENMYTNQQMISGLSSNPQWVEQQDRDTHNMAIASLAYVRSTKPNVMSLMFRGVAEPLSKHPSFAVNSAGNFLKMLTVFQAFWSNSVISMLGLQGPADFAAFWLDGRKKSKLTRRFQAALQGKEFQPERDEVYDMSEVLEGMDLADSFIRSGITHTGLFTLGMLAGELGLSGEDEEEKWRRRAAENQGAGFIRDARKVQADFRNKDSIYLNWLPWGMDSWFLPNPDHPDRTPPMAGMSWTMRYFMSPIIGMERFFESGDFTEVIHGFKDAVGAHPIMNTSIYNSTMDTVAMLHKSSNEAIENGDDMHGANLLITAVGQLERMLLENSMVNAIYVNADRYDRDPYVLPALDSDGNPQVDVRGNPYETNEALRTRLDEGGPGKEDDVIATGYVQRDANGALLRSYTENRFTLALLASITSGVTGGEGDLFRQQMPIKVRTVELEPTSKEEMTANLLAAYHGQQVSGAGGPQVGLTESEASQVIKKFYEDRGIWWEADEVEKQAKIMSAKSGMAAMSFLDEFGREHLTTEGARATFDGLWAGAQTLDSPSLDGVYITREMRDEIRDDIAKEIVQEGVDMHLTLDQATWRMRRIMFGTGTVEGTTTMADLIYSDKISYADKLEYNQLNTTYVIGPDGLPWSTGFTRGGFLGAIGLRNLRPMWTPEDTGLGMDSRGNTVDNVVGINTGLRALEQRGETWEIPTTEEVIRQAAKDVIDALKDIDFSPTPAYAKTSGSGYKPFKWHKFPSYKRRGYSRNGYGGYGGGSFYFNRMYEMPSGNIPYGNNIPFINASNPLIRRADIRRERVWSERGRLKQWQ